MRGFHARSGSLITVTGPVAAGVFGRPRTLNFHNFRGSLAGWRR